MRREMPFVIRSRSKRNAYVGEGTEPVSRKDATLYATQADAEVTVASAAQRLGVDEAELEVLRQPTSGVHRNDDPLDPYIWQVQPYIKSGQFDRDEVEYKIEIISKLGGARAAMLDGDDTWPTLVRRAFPQTGSPIQWMALDSLVKWFTTEPERAREAITALWADDNVMPADRVQSFLTSLPDGVLPSGAGTRLRSVAGLLMELGPEYPPYTVTKFNAAYDATGYARPPQGSSEGETYIHALGFLDKLVERAQALGYERPADRLEAQSVVWMQSWIGDQPPALWQVRAETDGESAPKFLELGRIDIGFSWHHDLGEVDSRAELTERYREQYPERTGNAPTQLWRFAHEIESGDLILVPLPDRQVHIGEVTGDYRFDENPSGHSHIRDIDWLAQNVPHERIGKAATDAFVRWTVQEIDDPDAMEGVQAFLADPDGIENSPSLEDLGRELLLEPQGYLGTIGQLLEEKKQVIFQGPPGTGKTYVARRLARALAGSDERVRLVQFHPSYAYEDFVQGFRPTIEGGQAGFTLRNGPLVEMAEQARRAPDAKHFLVIDEINRGNLAKVFGELYFLLEYRDQPMQIQYAREGDEDFSLPDNLYIIGTMNTADRSIALVDLALRRRFSFVEFHPEKEPIKGLLGRWLEREEVDMPWLADAVELANGKLENREAAIGPSYFMKDGLDAERVARIWTHDVLPYVEEQLYGQHERLAEFELEALRRELDGGGETDGATGDEQEGEDGSGDADA